MSIIQIKTLTQVHIGNGSFLQQGNDFVVNSEGDNSDVYILSIDKLGKLIGDDATSVALWMKSIEKGDSASFLKKYIQGHPYGDYAKRRITNYTKFSSQSLTLKECIHDGMGRPYIPGSSIKGSIRTAILANLAGNIIQTAISECNTLEERKKTIAGMEKRLLGRTADTDVFRFLCTGDAFFQKGSEIAVKQINLNITGNDRLKDFSKSQIVEAIGTDEVSSFRLNIQERFFEFTKIKGEQGLFEVINNHTRKLVEEEIDYWDGYAEDVKDYVASMEDILNEIDKCRPDECVLRIGQGSGWRFITGAWLEAVDRDFFRNEIVPLCRPKNNQYYRHYDFPKTRRIDDESYVFGFVKLKIK